MAKRQRPLINDAGRPWILPNPASPVLVLPPPARHVCSFDGCGRSFIRKEHLTRHKKSHSDQRSFFCHHCQRGFSRNDILQRHIERHSEDPAYAAEIRVQACRSCQGNGGKCEGGFACRSCVKGGIACISKQSGGTANQVPVSSEPKAFESSNGTNEDTESGNAPPYSSSSVNPSLPKRVPPMPAPSSKRQRRGGHIESELTDTTGSQALNTQIGTSVARNGLDCMSLPTSAPIVQPTVLPVAQQTLRANEIDVRVALDPPQAVSSANVDLNTFNLSFSPKSDQFPSVNVDEQSFYATMHRKPWYPNGTPDSVTKDYYELYLAQFHHRWPIIHVPTVAKGNNPYVLSASIEMVGSWLVGTSDSRGISLTLHDRLMNHIFERLYQKSLYTERYKSWSLVLHQAALLNIILGIYSGKENLISRVALLLNILITSLRDMGFFQSEITKLQDGESSYVPYLAIRDEERKRLGVTLLKVDGYLSIIRNQPTSIRVEELYFPLPSTFSFFNAPGLQGWEERKLEEPSQRGQETVSSMVSDCAFSSITQPFILPEDIQLGLCTIQFDVWQYVESVHNGRAEDMHNLLRQKSLRERLSSWKRLLDQTCFEESKVPFIKRTQMNYVPLVYYHGMEDHSKPGWLQVTMNRPQSLLFDAMILYHCLELQMNADGPRLYILSSLRKQLSTSHGWTGKRELEEKCIHWSKRPCARQALWHAFSIIEIYQSREKRLNEQNESLNKTTDPIIYATIAKAALVVWGYAFFNDKACSSCAEPGYISDAFELTEVPGNSTEMGDWIEAGGRAAVGGTVLCRCNVESLMGKFRDCLPTGDLAWDMAETVSGEFYSGHQG